MVAAWGVGAAAGGPQEDGPECMSLKTPTQANFSSALGGHKRAAQMASDAMIPMGRSRCGRLHSSAVLQTASKPMYEKKTSDGVDGAAASSMKAIVGTCPN